MRERGSRYVLLVVLTLEMRTIGPSRLGKEGWRSEVAGKEGLFDQCFHEATPVCHAGISGFD